MTGALSPVSPGICRVGSLENSHSAEHIRPDGICRVGSLENDRHRRANAGAGICRVGSLEKFLMCK